MPSAAKAASATVKENLTVEHVNNRYRFSGPCFCCGALPADQVNNPWGQVPWIVTKKKSGGIRFLIDDRDEDNPDVFTGFAMSVHGKLAKLRYAFHRSHFEEELPD